MWFVYLVDQLQTTGIWLHTNAFQTIFSFFQNQNSAGFHNFDLFKWNHSAKKRKFHKKNRKTVYMLKKWALLRFYGGMRRIKARINCSYFWGLQFLYNFLPLQVVKTGGREKRTVLVTLTFSIFYGQRNFFRRNPHCLYISPFIRSKIRTLAFSLCWNSEKKLFSLFRKQGSEIRTLESSLHWNSEKKNVFSFQKARVRNSDP